MLCESRLPNGTTKSRSGRKRPASAQLRRLFGRLASRNVVNGRGRRRRHADRQRPVVGASDVVRTAGRVGAASVIVVLRAVNLTGEVSAISRSVQSATSVVFTTAIGTPLEARNVGRVFDEMLKEAGVPDVRFHDLRHTAATLLLVQGVDARTTMETLGHSQISLTLNTYSHVLPRLQGAAAAKIDEMLAVSVSVSVSRAYSRQRRVRIS